MAQFGTTNTAKSEPHEKKMSPGECEAFAEAFVDSLLKMPPFFLTGALLALENWNRTTEIPRKAGYKRGPSPASMLRLKQALASKDRKRSIELVKAICFEYPPTPDHFDSFVKGDFSGSMRKAIEQLARQFTATRGRKRKVQRSQYREIAERGDSLYPVCLKIVIELRSSKHRSVSTLLQLWQDEFPNACPFLLSHLSRLEAALNDKRLGKRAKQIEPFARLIADGIAGAEYGLTARTSIERAREGRRMLSRTRP